MNFWLFYISVFIKIFQTKKSIETLIDNIETDEKDNISNSDFKDYCFIIDCIIIRELIKSLPD